MKKIIILFSLMIFNIGYAQKYIDTLYNFKVQNEKLIWQKVYDLKTDNPKSNFIKSVISNIKKTDLQEFEETLTFEIKDDEIDFKKYGGKWGNTAIFVQYPQNYLVVVEFKDKRYRVTIKSITVDFTEPGAGTTELTDLVVKRKVGKIKNREILTKALSYYDKHFDSKFLIKNEKDEW